MAGCGRAWVLGLLLVGCAPVTPASNSSDDAEHEEPIIGGDLDSGDLPVVALARRTAQGPDPFCSGTLIAPSTVLTAAHCVYIYGTEAQYVALFGSDASAPTEVVPVTQQLAHPEFDRTGQLENDVALFRLEHPVTSVAPIPLNRTPLTQSDLGRNLRHVGYGVFAFSSTGSKEFDGKKRTGEHAISKVQARVVESGAATSQTCMGDSGGPGLFITEGSPIERVASLVSYGDSRCQSYGADTRVDVYTPWIESTLSGWEQPGCVWDGSCQLGCQPVDPDCACAADGVCGADCPEQSADPDCPSDCGAGDGCSLTTCPAPDPDCSAVGAVCSTANTCGSRQCLSDAQHAGYCSAPCLHSQDCPSGMQCIDGLCGFPPPPGSAPPMASLPAMEVGGRAAKSGGCSSAGVDSLSSMWLWVLSAGLLRLRLRRDETADHQRG